MSLLLLALPAASQDAAFCASITKRHEERLGEPAFLESVIQARYASALADRRTAARYILKALDIPPGPEGLRQARSLTESRNACLWWGHDLISYLAQLERPDEASRRVLLQGLDDTHYATRKNAIRALGAVSGEDVIAALSKSFTNDPDPEVKEMAACTLASTGIYSRARRLKMVPFFESAARSPGASEKMREFASKAVASIMGQGPDKGFGRECIWFPQELIQQCVDFHARYVGRWREGAAFQKNITRLLDLTYNSSDFQERASAGSAILTAVGVPEDRHGLAVARLLTYAADPWCNNWGYQLISYLDLAQIRDASSKQDLVRGLDHKDPGVRISVVMALGAYSDEDLIPLIFKAYRSDPYPGVRERAACSLSHTGIYTRAQRLRMVPFFIGTLKEMSVDQQTRNWAAQALHYITGESYGRNADQWQEWRQKADGTP